ncbi:MAG TPA: phosphatase PAP2 family protein [Ktedonobacteraceae bacterium]|jgi:undecaprenyl-diphosphatase|nr:phosphatase PAP2 family protein [Ktedonobacteraceae bacterium]
MSSTSTKTRNGVTKIITQVPQANEFLQKNVLRGNTFRLVIALVSGGLFAWLASFIHNKALLLLDIYLTHKLQKRKNPLLIGFAKAISYVNTHVLLNIVAVPIALVLWIKRLRLESGMMIGLLVTSTFTRLSVQRLINRPRPNPLFVRIKRGARGKSFPSGHVIASTTFWGWLLTIYQAHGGRNKAFLIIPRAFIVLSGPSRVYLGKHWTSDVTGGYLISGALLSLFSWVYHLVRQQ